jgi:hypothetical protein
LVRDSWRDADFDLLFAAHPPTIARAPKPNEARAVARALRRSTGAVRSQWDDARSAVLSNQTAASRSLREYLTRRGWLPGRPDAQSRPAQAPPGG